jgi:Prenyltransferase and squalene oxidase repeat
MMRHFISILLLGHACAQELPRRQDDTIPSQVDQMYERGLRFLASKQNDEGCWDDSQGSEPGVVGLATVAFLAHGEDPNYGPYAKNIGKGISFIISKQNTTNGYIGNSMYSHGFATLALAEAYGMIENPKLAPALKNAVDLILSAQKRNRNKAWRYTPDASDADTTVSGCQLVALLAARNAGIVVPDEAIKNALAFMERCRSADGSYGYTSAGGGKPTLTAIGLLCQSLAKKKDGKGFAASLAYLKNHINYREPYYPFYFEYYMSQALFHADQKVWEEWNAKNIKLMSTLQSPDGSWPGRMGYAFNTSGALLSLALNYRFLPIYEK